MNLLLDFMNVKKWNTEILIELFKTHGINTSNTGRERGYDTYFFSPAFEKTMFFLVVDDFAQAWKECGVASFPGEPLFDDYFKYLKKLCTETWADILDDTRTNGANIELLTDIARRVKLYIRKGGSPWAVKMEVSNLIHYRTIESLLDLDYLGTFLNGDGELFKRLRVCRKPACKKWFCYNRPKQTFCSDKCRLAFHNAIYSANGKAAAHQRKGRIENPDIYLK